MQTDSVLTAMGARVRKDEFDELARVKISILEYGAGEDKAPESNTKAINAAISAAHERGGAMVVVPKGVYPVYTILLQSNVILYLSEGSVLQAAEPKNGGADPDANYGEPEVNYFVGLQDHGHCYFANSLIYGRDLENIMIDGPGCIRGYEERNGVFHYILQNGDPENPVERNTRGHRGKWFGNKGIALVNCQKVWLSGFSLVVGGHFAVIAEGVTDLALENVLLDTTRDALNIDCCERVTVRGCTLNSLTDDALVLKASFSLGKLVPTRDVLIEDCVVCGYDAGSVYAGTYTREKLVAEDRCGPTGRVKLGTESTGGYAQITIRRVKFERSRGFALEAVDGSPLTDILFEDCEMNEISSSPIWLRAGDRCRYPVTGTHKTHSLVCEEDKTRKTRKEWVLPNLPEYGSYPPARYAPCYRKEKEVTVDNQSYFTIADSAPTEQNACGSSTFAEINRVVIRNVTIKDADPRYPILLMGLTSSRLKNITLENIDVTYRGGLSMEHAVEQRQLNTNWKFRQYRAAEEVQSLPWLVNAFFAQNEALLPRVDYDPSTGGWKENPYNVPEAPGGYPEPSSWGILPAYGLYARHVEGLKLRNLHFHYMLPDGRHVMVMDDVEEAALEAVSGDCVMQTEEIALVTHHYKRPTNFENVPEEPYFSTHTRVQGIPKGWRIKEVEVMAPEPGTLSDSLYGYPTAATQENGYEYKVKTEEYPLPVTVFRPFLTLPRRIYGGAGEHLQIPVTYRSPMIETNGRVLEKWMHQDRLAKPAAVVCGEKEAREAADCIQIKAISLPEGCTYEEGLLDVNVPKEKGEILTVRFRLEDGCLASEYEVKIIAE